MATLEALLERAGASDVDRDAWLAERIDGITATQIRDLYLLGPGYRADLLQEKLHRTIEPELRNRYVAWGNQREPIIAEKVRAKYSIQPESRVFRAADNPRLLCSPDGVGQGFDGLEISEIKTGKDDIAPGTPAFDRKGYLLQMIWGMRITGARRCLYAWEQHDSDWQDRGGDFVEPAPLGEPGMVWIEYDEHLAAELEVLALEFLADLDALRADHAAGLVPEYDDNLDTLAVNYLRFHREESSATKAKKEAWEAMKAALAGHATFSQETSLARITWTRGGATTEQVPDEIADVDAAAAASDHPELVKEQKLAEKALERATKRVADVEAAWAAVLPQYTTFEPIVKTVTTTTRENLTVTAPKAFKDGAKR